MPNKRKVDLHVLQKMLIKGEKTYAEMGEVFGVSKVSIHRAIKKIRYSQAKDITMNVASEMNRQTMAVIDRLDRTTAVVEKEIEFIREKMEGCKDVAERRKWEDRLFRGSAENRQQLKVLSDLYRTAIDLHNIEEFKTVVLEEIDNAAPEIKTRILERIRQRGAPDGISAGGGQNAECSVH